MRLVIAILLALTVATASGAAGTGGDVAAITAQVAAALNSSQPQSAVDLVDAQVRLQEAIELAPEYAPIYHALGELQLERADYFYAAAAFEAALGLYSFDSQARRGQIMAARLSDFVLQFQLPFPQRVFGLAEVSTGGRPGVFLLIGTPELWLPEWPSVQIRRVPSGDARLAVWGPRLLQAQPRLLSPEVRYYTWHSRGYLSGYQEAFRARGTDDGQLLTFWRTWVGDFQRTGRSQALLVMGWTGAAWTPTYVDIFETAGDSLRQVLHVDSVFPPELVDLDGDGRFEVKTEQFVGEAGRGAWYDLYAYDGWEYVRANELFPALAEEQLARMLDLEKRYPGDSDVQARVEQAYREAGY